jgi:alkylation response protein AidB-like acyl-CoA dehydrogenase
LSARRWLAENKHHAPPDYGPIMPPGLLPAACAWQRRLAEAGYVFFEMSEADKAEWLAECAAGGVPPVLNMVGLVLAAGAIQSFGSPVHQKLLAATGRGEIVWCQLFSEPGAGSDLAGLTCSAVPDGDEFVVNGQKTWSSNASAADMGLLLARTGPDRHRGITMFALDMRAPGVEVRPIRQMTGEAEFDDVFLTDVRVPAASAIGPVDQGWMVTMATLGNERAYIGSSVAALQRRLGGASASGAVERDRLARLHSAAFALSAIDMAAGPSASLVKLGVTEAMFELAVSFGRDREVVAAPGARLGGGTSEVQRNIIGELVLGLPKEPR